MISRRQRTRCRSRGVVSRWKIKEFSLFPPAPQKKNKEKFGPDVPDEALVYQDKFVRVVDSLKKKLDEETLQNLEKPEITLETQSFNTLNSVREIITILKTRGWKRLALMTSGYHIPQTRALLLPPLSI